MVSVTESWDIIQNELSNKQLLLLLDYDGTLAPIASHPDKALISQETKEILKALVNCPQCHLVVISGRRLAEISAMIGVEGIAYIGNHGFEIENSMFNFENLIPVQYQVDLLKIKELLQARLSRLQGIWLEDKGIILTMHFREAQGEDAVLAQDSFMEICQGFLTSGRIKITRGKKVLEIRPPIQWDKGEAALWVLGYWQRQLGKEHLATVYVGDDVTDEDAFLKLKDMAVTIKVGKDIVSAARFCLNNQKDMVMLLNKIFIIENEALS